MRKVDRQLAQRFTELADATEEVIRRFAERWGPLGLSTERSTAAEALSDWRKFAVLARALLRNIAAIRQKKPGSAEDWKAISAWLREYPDPDLLNPTARYRLLRQGRVASALNRWYARCQDHTLVTFHRERLVIQPEVASLLGAIVVQIAFGMVDDNTLVCYHCSRFFHPRRIPSTGTRQFCPRCRKASKPQLYAMRDLRLRSKTAG